MVPLPLSLAVAGDVGGIGKVQIAEFDGSLNLGAWWYFCACDRRFGIGRENVVEPAHRSRTTLKDVGYPPEAIIGQTRKPRYVLNVIKRPATV